MPQTGGALIGDVLDLTCSVEGCLVQPGVCESLDELKTTQQALPDMLTQVNTGNCTPCRLTQSLVKSMAYLWMIYLVLLYSVGVPPTSVTRACWDPATAMYGVVLQVVESELQRVPPHVARRYSKQLWSVVYIPQVVACIPTWFIPSEW